MSVAQPALRLRQGEEDDVSGGLGGSGGAAEGGRGVAQQVLGRPDGGREANGEQQGNNCC